MNDFTTDEALKIAEIWAEDDSASRRLVARQLRTGFKDYDQAAANTIRLHFLEDYVGLSFVGEIVEPDDCLFVYRIEVTAVREDRGQIVVIGVDPDLDDSHHEIPASTFIETAERTDDFGTKVGRPESNAFARVS